MREPLHDTADEMKRRAGSIRNRARETASNVRSQAKDQFSAAGHRLRDASRSGVERQKGWAATEMRHISGAMREAARKLHQENDEQLATFADSAAEQTTRISEYLDDADVDRLVDDAGDFARRRPEIFYGTMFIAGLALARFLKASRPDYEPGYRSSSSTEWRGRDEDEMDYNTYAYDNDEERFHAAAGTSAAPSSMGARTSGAQTGTTGAGSGSSAAGHTPPAP